MDRFAALSAYAAVIEEGSFTGAARKLRVAKSAVSKHVQALEDELGVRLLNRTTRQVNPTDEGENYYTHIRRVLADLAEADEAVRSHNDTPRGQLRISAPMSFGLLHVASAVADFLMEYPELRIETVLDDRYVDLVEGGFDLAIRIGKLSDSSLKARRIAPSRIVLVASPAYLAKHGTPAHPRELAGHQLLHYSLLSSGNVWRLVGPDGEHSIRVQPTMTANNGDILHTASLAGNGIALQPTFIVGPDVHAGRLVHLLPAYAAPEIAIYAVYPPGRHLSPKVRAFIDFFVARCGPEPYWEQL